MYTIYVRTYIVQPNRSGRVTTIYLRETFVYIKAKLYDAYDKPNKSHTIINGTSLSKTTRLLYRVSIEKEYY